jgi:hypothetical protein
MPTHNLICNAGVDVVTDRPYSGVGSLNKQQLVQFAVGIIGFLMYKVTLVSVSLAPSEQQRE